MVGSSGTKAILFWWSGTKVAKCDGFLKHDKRAYAKYMYGDNLEFCDQEPSWIYWYNTAKEVTKDLFRFVDTTSIVIDAFRTGRYTDGWHYDSPGFMKPYGNHIIPSASLDIILRNICLSCTPSILPG